MRSSQPTRLPADVYDSAVAAAARESRTVPQQIAHWARIGRAMEASHLDRRDIQRVLDGEAPYSSLGEREQAVVRSEWDERIDTALADLNFAEEFAANGDTWVVGDGRGGAVTKTGTGRQETHGAPDAHETRGDQQAGA